MREETVRDLELSDEELGQNTGGKRARQREYVGEPKVITLALGEEGQDTGVLVHRSAPQ